MVEDGDPRVLETLARATVSMTEAEVFQLERKRSGTTGEADYLRIITQKTASFMSACCRIGALLGRASPEQVEGLTRYGLDIGIAFQISDDSLDFVADQARLGKAVGADLKEGKRTLPLIATIERAGPADRDRIHALLKQPRADSRRDRGDPPARGQARGRRVRARAGPRVCPEREGRARALPEARTTRRRWSWSPISSSIATARPLPGLITLTTDFGLRDPFVGIMKGVLLSICPSARLVDLTHEVPPQDVLAGGSRWRRRPPFFPAGTVHLAVVDPGVGTARRALAVRAGGSYFVGPDNGLFTFALEGAGWTAVSLDRAGIPPGRGQPDVSRPRCLRARRRLSGRGRAARAPRPGGVRPGASPPTRLSPGGRRAAGRGPRRRPLRQPDHLHPSRAAREIPGVGRDRAGGGGAPPALGRWTPTPRVPMGSRRSSSARRAGWRSS